MIFSFASHHTIAAVLLYENDEGHEKPIAFFNQVVQDAKLKYNVPEKQSITYYVPTGAVKDILVQGDSEGKRGKWITNIQEYEMEIKPTKLIKGQGLAKILSESNCQALGINFSMTGGEAQEDTCAPQGIEKNTHVKYLLSSWYKDIV